MSEEKRDAKWFLEWMKGIVFKRVEKDGRMFSDDGVKALEATWAKRCRVLERKPEWFDEHRASMFRRLNKYAEQLILAAEFVQKDAIDAEVVEKGSKAFAAVTVDSPFCPPPDEVSRG